MRSGFLGLLGLLLACAPPNAGAPYPETEPPDGDAAPTQDADATPEKPASAGIARYFEREVDLEPFLVGFPYSRFRGSLETGQLFYYETGDQYSLRSLDVPEQGAFDLGRGTAVGDIDWSKRSLWSIKPHKKSGKLWLHADATNNEKMNLWTLEQKSGALSQLTFHDYVYGFGFDEAQERVAYLPRAGKKAPFRTCLRVREVGSGREKEILCDNAKLKFTWGSPHFSPDGREVFFNAQTEGDRNRVQLVRVDLTASKPTPKFVTDPKVRRNSPSALEGWVGDEKIFTANDDGFNNLFAYDRVKKKVRQLTRFKEDITSAELTDEGVIGVHRTPAGSTLFLVNTSTGDVLDSAKLKGTADVLDAHGKRAIVNQRAPDVVYEAHAVRVDGGRLVMEEAIGLDPDLEEGLVRCTATAVKIPTFDVDKKTGKKRELHAFLLEPKEPVRDAKQKMALITAFYGGRNAYSKYDHIMCAAGLTLVSPAVRGSSGFGKDFKGLNDKDLGGDEIVDLFYVARWLEKRAGLKDRRIGVYGGSHGGYATMRALTFPPETNGRSDLYPFGFGLSHAGFSDIKTFYDATNIPDWVVLESGDPNKPKELTRMKDRSPLSHVSRLRAPILLTHGSQDWRVPVDESRQFVKAARGLERPVTYVEIEGQGHHIEGLALQVQTYQARFDFLMAVAKAAPE